MGKSVFSKENSRLILLLFSWNEQKQKWKPSYFRSTPLVRNVRFCFFYGAPSSGLLHLSAGDFDASASRHITVILSDGIKGQDTSALSVHRLKRSDGGGRNEMERMGGGLNEEALEEEWIMRQGEEEDAPDSPAGECSH